MHSWHYVLDPNIKRTQWTEEEEDIIVTYHNQFGNKWSKIAKHLVGRSAEAIRNHWNCRRNALTARWKGRKAKQAAASEKAASGATAAWQPASSSGMAPPLAQPPYYTSKAADAAATQVAAKAPAQKGSADKITEETTTPSKTTPSQPPALYPSSENTADRDNWSRVSRGRVFSADACADIGTMPSSVGSSSACVESQSLILPFSYKPSGASL